MSTKMLYLDSNALEKSAKVIEISGNVVILDQTIFYAQGGGQPCDKGRIVCGKVVFIVEDVKKEKLTDSNTEIISHIGKFINGTFKIGDAVNLFVDADRRLLNSRLHTAGHLIDSAIENIGLQLIPGKGYHYPEGAYVEYAGTVEETERENIRSKLENECNTLIEKGNEVQIKEVDFADVGRIILNTSDYLKPGMNVRVVTVSGKHGCPCGGTHVRNISEIGSMQITKIKSAGSGRTRVSYSVQH